MIRVYKEITKSLIAWLQDTTSWSQAQVITKLLDAYCSRSTTTADKRWPENIREAFNLQTQMGERALVEGFIHIGWEETQGQYLESIASRRSPQRWTRLLIQKILMVSWDMWDARNDIVHNNSETRQKQIEAALDVKIREIHKFGKQNQFLPQTAKHFLETAIEDIIKRTNYQKRI